MRLSILAELILKSLKAEPWMAEFHLPSALEIFQIIDFSGPSNQHLANPLNQKPWTGYVRPRAVTMTGDEEVDGENLLFHYVRHSPTMTLRDFSTLGELEAHILSGAGITNDYTTGLVAIVYGQVKPYTVTYLDAKTNQRRAFDKAKQYTAGQAFRDYDERQIHWVG